MSLPDFDHNTQTSMMDRSFDMDYELTSARNAALSIIVEHMLQDVIIGLMTSIDEEGCHWIGPAMMTSEADE